MPAAEYFADQALRQDLRRKTLRGGLFTGAGQGVTLLNTLVSLPILSRLLEPSDFGLVAMVTPLTGFAAIFVDAGRGVATIQRPELNHRQASALFWCAAGLGVAVAGLLALCSPLVAWFYGDPRVATVTLALCLSFVFSGLTVQHEALLRRAMRFDRLLAVQATASLVALTITVAIAWGTRSFWALALRPVVESAVRMLGAWAACGWIPGAPQRGAGVRELFGMGAGLTGSTILGYVAANIDFVAIGRYWGEAVLGGYERAFRCFWQPLAGVQEPLTQLMVPALSRLADDPARQRSVLLMTTERMWSAMASLTTCLVIAGPFVVRVLLGPKWDHVVPIFCVLSLAGVAQPLYMAGRWALVTQGRPRDLMTLGGVFAAAALAAIAVTLPHGALAVAIGFAVTVFLVRLPFGLWIVGRRGPVRALDLAGVPLRCWPGPLAVAAACLAVRPLLSLEHAVASLALVLAVGAAAWAASLPLTRSGRAFAADLVSFARAMVVRVRPAPRA